MFSRAYVSIRLQAIVRCKYVNTPVLSNKLAYWIKYDLSSGARVRGQELTQIPIILKNFFPFLLSYFVKHFSWKAPLGG